MEQHDADWGFLAYALSDAAAGMEQRWDAVAHRAGSGKRATKHAELLQRLGKDLRRLSAVIGAPAFAASDHRADRALADAVAGPLAALGEDLRALSPPMDDRVPAFDD